jgi:hypothetical protein
MFNRPNFRYFIVRNDNISNLKMTNISVDFSNKNVFEQMKFELVTVEILAFGNLEFEVPTYIGSVLICI